MPKTKTPTRIAADTERASEPFDTHGLRIASGIAEVDRLLGGGFRKGTVLCLYGDPGGGKSGLAMMLLDGIAKLTERPVVFASSEERRDDICEMAGRLPVVASRITLLGAQYEGWAVRKVCEEHKPAALVIDTFHKMTMEDVGGTEDSLSQATAVIDMFSGYAKETGMIVIFVAHANRNGGVKAYSATAPVDVMLRLERAGNRYGNYSIEDDAARDPALRALTVVKSRFSREGEVAFFTMSPDGSGLVSTVKPMSPKVLSID